MSDFTRRRWARRWLPYALGGVLLAGILYAVPVRAIWDALRASSPVPLALALVILLGSRLPAAVRTKVLTDGQGLALSIPRIIEIGCASTLYGMALPGSLSGGVVRWYRFSQPKGNRSGALVVLAAERAVDYLVLALLGMLCWIVDSAAGRPAAVFWVLTAVAAIMLLVSLYAFSYRGGEAERTAQETAPSRGWLPPSLVQGFRRLASAFAAYRLLGRRKIFLMFAASLVFHGAVTVSHYLMALSLGLGVSPVTMGWVRACLLLATALPVTPAGLGVREVSLVVLLGPLGVTAAEAVALSLLLMAGLLSAAVLGAVFEVRRFYMHREGAHS